MGYLQLTDGMPDFSKVVISLWFRIPQASIDAAAAQYASSGVRAFMDAGGGAGTGVSVDFNLAGIIPLITFGPNSEMDAESHSISPCVIGVSCGQYNPYSNFTGDAPTLYARIQYASGAVGYSSNTFNDFFQMGANTAPTRNASSAVLDPLPIPVTADTWHHVLVSFDMTAGCSSTVGGVGDPPQPVTVCRFWWAFDDVNYSGAYLWPAGSANYGGVDLNGIISQWCFYISDSPPHTVPSSYSFAAGAIPTDAKPIGIPSSSGNIAKIYKVETAELQIFTGVTLDTSVEANRRAFIKADGSPQTDYSIPELLLGKNPEIRLAGDSFWKSGVNSGSLGGTFEKTGTINTYSTGPDITP